MQAALRWLAWMCIGLHNIGWCVPCLHASMHAFPYSKACKVTCSPSCAQVRPQGQHAGAHVGAQGRQGQRHHEGPRHRRFLQARRGLVSCQYQSGQHCLYSDSLEPSGAVVVALSRPKTACAVWSSFLSSRVECNTFARKTEEAMRGFTLPAPQRSRP